MMSRSINRCLNQKTWEATNCDNFSPLADLLSNICFWSIWSKIESVSYLFNTGIHKPWANCFVVVSWTFAPKARRKNFESLRVAQNVECTKQMNNLLTVATHCQLRSRAVGLLKQKLKSDTEKVCKFWLGPPMTAQP